MQGYGFIIKVANIFDHFMEFERELLVALHVKLDIDIGGFLDVSDHTDEVLESVSNQFWLGNLESLVHKLEELRSDPVEEWDQVGF